MHPLAPDLSQLSEDELHKKFNDLQGRFTQAYRFGPVSVIPQLQMLMADYQEEIARRQAKMMQDMEERANRDGKGFKNIIDIS
jgi:hypothetical protein